MSEWLDPGGVEAVGTWAAVVAASVAGVFAYRALRVEQRRDDRQAELDRRAQADLVSAWIDQVHWHPKVPSTGVRVRNASTAGVYDVTVWVVVGHDIARIGQKPVIGPNEHAEFVLTPDAYAMMRPAGAAVTAPIPSDILNSARTVVSFTDSAGERWSRGRNGILHPDVNAS